MCRSVSEQARVTTTGYKRRRWRLTGSPLMVSNPKVNPVPGIETGFHRLMNFLPSTSGGETSAVKTSWEVFPSQVILRKTLLGKLLTYSIFVTLATPSTSLLLLYVPAMVG